VSGLCDSSSYTFQEEYQFFHMEYVLPFSHAFPTDSFNGIEGTGMIGSFLGFKSYKGFPMNF